jgi:hypothetical protein
MKKVLLVIFLILNTFLLLAQKVLTIEGTEVTDATTGRFEGVIIPRDEPTVFTYKNNSITSVNFEGYMLQAGDETPGVTNNNLDGEVITGNKLTWNGTDETSWTHAMFTGYNINAIIKYNYLDKTPNGIQRKSDGMTDISGAVAYNIIKNPKVGIVVKGMNGVKIYNNTLYTEKTPAQTSRGLIDIHANTDGGLNAMSTGVKVFNNIFYTRNKTLNIKIYETGCLDGFESDYNVFWCESGEPIFEINGLTKTFTQWQALGYDLHSIVLNPDFDNFTDFVPRQRLDYGKDLGSAMQTGLSIDAVWGKTDPVTTMQNGKWQAGARIYEASDKKVSIYPNPAFEYFCVELTDTAHAYKTVKVYDMNGRVVLTNSLEQGKNTIDIPKSFPAGIYSITLEADNLDRYVRKLLIIR